MNEQDTTGQAQTLDRALGRITRARVRRALAKPTKTGSSTHLSRYGKAFDKSVYAFTINTQ